MHPMLTIAIRAARAAGDSIVREMDRTYDISIEDKGKNDFVTEVDRNAEEIIISTIQKSYSDHAFLGEETGQRGKSDYIWIIDPLDGTTNFLHSFPHFAVSIALQHKGILEQAVIYDPLKQELFTATKGKGALLNNRKIRVSAKNELDGALLGTGFPYNNEKAMLKFIESYKALFPRVAGIRRAGVASLDLAYVASGRLDGFWEFNLKQWDIAAGILLIQEAGGISAELTGGVNYLESGNIISANPKLLKAMLKIVS
ncbi:MAG: inositol monophosphatase [Legionellales bacterium]|nr:inositol monophosphatase [Legionellales bacterium]